MYFLIFGNVLVIRTQFNYIPTFTVLLGVYALALLCDSIQFPLPTFDINFLIEKSPYKFENLHKKAES